MPLGQPPPGVNTTIPPTARRHRAAAGRERRRQTGRARAATRSSTRSGSCRRTTTPRPLADDRQRAADRREHLGRLPRRGAAQRPASPVDALKALHRLGALQAVLRAADVPVLHWAATRRRPTTRCCARCSSGSPTTTSRTSSAAAHAGELAELFAAHGGAMTRARQGGQPHSARSDQALRARWRSCSRRSRARWATSRAARSWARRAS